MRSIQLQEAIEAFLEQAAALLHADVSAGQEVEFELEARSARMRGASLYCYRPLTAQFIAERYPRMRALEAHRHALAQLQRCEGLERYLLARGTESPPRAMRDADAVLLALLQDVFEEQTDFDPSWLAAHTERLERALERLDGSALAAAGEVTLVASLQGVAISSPEVPLARGLTIAAPQALRGAPPEALRAASAERGHLLVVHTAQDAPSGAEGVAEGAAVVRDLVRALRLFGDGRIALGTRAWARVKDGPWSTIALGAGGHPHGVLLVTPEQEDELRAFCALISRRTPIDTPIAWALRRFELGCERPDEREALSDHLLALRALLSEAPGDPSRAYAGADGLLAARLAALCAPAERRRELVERTLAAIELERKIIAGSPTQGAAPLALAREIADHLRALLRDVICGHLRPDLGPLADEILLADQPACDWTSELLAKAAGSASAGMGGSVGAVVGGAVGPTASAGPTADAPGRLPPDELPPDELPPGELPPDELPRDELPLEEQLVADGADPGEVLGVAV
ncbi:MAG TPA: hypothetical protein VHU13_01435 [Solirubrobacteraceae bacterium]|nr:hypothetical protein [Solirubrobacteraceae bacterium]